VVSNNEDLEGDMISDSKPMQKHYMWHRTFEPQSFLTKSEYAVILYYPIRAIFSKTAL